MKKLNADELQRYARHLVLPEIGGSGQQKLKAAKVLVIGAGGLGSPVLQYLAGAGIGTLVLVDNDVVALSNLQRQLVHDTENIDMPKVESAALGLGRINPHVEIITHQTRIDKANARDLLTECTLAIDGCDNFSTRYVVADACEAAQVPLISGAVNRFDGSLTMFKPWLKNADGFLNPRYRDLFPTEPPENLLPTCAQAGIVGASTGIIGSLMALEAIKEITGAGEGLIGKLLMVDGLGLRFETIGYKRKRIEN